MSEPTSTSEVDRVPQLDDSEIYWHEATASNGEKYRVGVRKSDYPDLSEQEVKDLLAGIKRGPPEQSRDGVGSGGTRPKITHDTGENPIYWPNTTTDDSWRIPAQRIKDKFDIKQYANCNNNGITKPIYSYTLWIYVTATWDYTFYDEAGSSYEINAFKIGSHWVNYNSSKPTIERIVASS